MKKITTIILGVASLVMAIVISAVESSSSGGGGFNTHLVRFDEDSVQTVTLMRGGDTLVMKKLKDYWFFVSPNQDRINKNSMEALLDQLNHLSILDRIESSELQGDMDPVKLGMKGEELLQVHIESVEDGKPKVDTLLLGIPTSRRHSIYARMGAGKNSEGILVVNGNPHDILDSPYETLLERKLVNVPSSALVQIAVQTVKNSLVLQRNITTEATTPWIMVQPIRSKADQDTVDSLISSLLSLQIFDVDDIEAGQMSVPNPLPEEAAVIQLRVLGAEKPVVLYLDKFAEDAEDFGPPLVSARISDRPATYRLNSTFLSTLNASAGAVRDRRLGNIPEKALESIAIVRKRPGSEVFLRSNRTSRGENWEVIVKGSNGIPANYTKIKDLISQMNEPVIIDFVEGGRLGDYGINQNQEGAMAVAFNFKIPGPILEDGSIGESEDFSRVLRLGWKRDGPKARLFANFQGENQIFELDPGFATFLPMHPIKWKSLSVLSFNPFHIVKITKEVKGLGKIELTYNKSLGSWKAVRGDGTDVTSSLDRDMAASLGDRLSSLKSIGWNQNVGEGYTLLEDPTATFTIVTRELDPATNGTREVTQVVKFADNDKVVYGQLGESLDLFFLDREKFKLLIRPLTSFTTK